MLANILFHKRLGKSLSHIQTMWLGCQKPGEGLYYCNAKKLEKGLSLNIVLFFYMKTFIDQVYTFSFFIPLTV